MKGMSDQNERGYIKISNTKCEGEFEQNYSNKDVALRECRNNPNCTMVENDRCAGKHFFLCNERSVEDYDDNSCCWVKGINTTSYICLNASP